MQLDRSWIEAHIPHRGTMCLLHGVLDWDAERIRCLGVSHRDSANPLRAHGRLGIAGGIEYAAQAMAVHGSLTSAGPATGVPATGVPATGTPAAGTPAAGFLAGLRGVRPYVHRLDDIRADLVCEAVRAAGDHRSALYDFMLSADGNLLLSGRATVILHAGGRVES